MPLSSVKTSLSNIKPLSQTTVNLDNTTINSEYSALYNYQYSDAVITDSSLTVNNTATSKTTYGIWNTSGIVTLGEAEPVTSVNYGGEHADVSTTDPLIKASTANTSSSRIAIAIKNETGKIYYYDGKIMGQTAAMPDNPAGVEYLYEPKDYAENGYQCRILEWMREQPGN